MQQQRSLIFITILAIAVSFANIGGLDVYALDEAKNAEAAREMLESGNYVVPHFNYELRTDKPPLHYYFMVAGYKLLGVNAAGARLFSSLLGVLTIVMTFLFARKHFGENVAIYAGLVLTASLHFALQIHMSVPDPYLIFFLSWGLFSFYEAYHNGSRWYLLAFYFAIGCGLLTKGPIALGLCGLSALLFLILNRDFKWKTIWRLQPFGGVTLSLLVALPWYYAVHEQTQGVWTDEFFFKHNFSRFSDAMEGHQGIFLLTFAYVFLLGMLSFLPFVFQSLKNAWFKSKEHPAAKFLLIVVSVILIFFAVSSTKLPNYTVPSYPFLAILVGLALDRFVKSPGWFIKTGNRMGYIAYSIFMVLFPVGIYFGLNADPSLDHLSYLALYFIPLSIMGVLLLMNLKKRSVAQAVQYLAGGWLITIVLFFYLIFPQVDQENPVRKTLPTMDLSQEIVAYQRLNAAYLFALQREVKRFDTLEPIRALVNSKAAGYVISRTEYREELESIPGLVYHAEAKDTFENPTTLVMKWGKP